MPIGLIVVNYTWTDGVSTVKLIVTEATPV
jgi:hypothetical protein